MKNALVVVEAGGARLVRDAECTGAKLDDVMALDDDARDALGDGTRRADPRSHGRRRRDRSGRRSRERVVTVFEPGVRVHVVGVGGAGMSGLARLLVETGRRSERQRPGRLGRCSKRCVHVGVTVAVGHDGATRRERRRRARGRRP